MTIYFTAGGLLSSAWVNAVQLVVLLVGLVVAVPLAISAAGGLDAILATPGLPDTFWDPDAFDRAGIGLRVPGLLGPAFVISPGLVQKAYGGRERPAVRAGIGAAGVAQLLFAFVPLLLGLAARHLHPDLANRDLVLPTLLVESLPWLVGTVALAAVFSAEVSTCDAILFMLSTSLSQDLYKRFINRQASDAQVLQGGAGRGVGRGTRRRAARRAVAERDRGAVDLLFAARRQPVRADRGRALRETRRLARGAGLDGRRHGHAALPEQPAVGDAQHLVQPQPRRPGGGGAGLLRGGRGPQALGDHCVNARLVSREISVKADMFRLDGKVVAVIGAGSGIGAAVAHGRGAAGRPHRSAAT